MHAYRSVNSSQIAVAVVVVAHQFLAVEGDGGEAVHRRRERRFSRGRLKVGFQTTSMLTANEIVKEQMVQTTLKKVLRSSEKQKPRACVLHTPYIGNGGFMRATACSTSELEVSLATVRLHLDKTFKKIKVIFIKCN